MLATLDRVSHGRVICTLGAGSDKSEYAPYELEWIEDHDARIAYGREVALALKLLWTHPAPERMTFEGTYVRSRAAGAQGLGSDLCAGDLPGRRAASVLREVRTAAGAGR